ncbi:hypothetical protein BDZ90DRAFT_170193 [Jaminaea rosea]|uniref:Uncharacterized protein n=1 Tax=Jaminaea rosea TaxID=1569628 RepID=A0A316UR05_9BASI|nr:hypothetical protein BDZ90DRAFT_170193 [Jaminaea rosea]PWN27716.1 hypothetical protein BDZ90DRAFT_170193 [Jaminaea rosea]
MPALNGHAHANGSVVKPRTAVVVEDYIDDPLNGSSLSSAKRVISRDTTSSSDTIQPPGASMSPSSSSSLQHSPPLPLQRDGGYASRREYSDSSSTTMGGLGSPFGEDSETGHGGENGISMLSQDGWMAHASTERLTEQRDGSKAGGRNGHAYGATPSSYKRMSSQSTSTASSSAGPGMVSSSLRRGGGREEDEEGDDEAKQVEQNLERWAAAERQRRKAARSSRTNSLLGPPADSATTSLARRLSSFGRRTPSGPTTGLTAGSNGRSGYDNDGSSSSAENLRRFSATQSFSSAESYLTEGSSVDSSIGSQRGRRTAAAMATGADRKGKARALDHEDGEGGDMGSPFSDPSEGRRGSAGADDAAAAVARRRSVKPTATRPIVTPGRAPSIRRTPAGTPSIIVATDVDASKGANEASSSSASPSSAGGAGPTNPFLTSNEAASANGGNYPLTAISETDQDEDDGAETTGSSSRTPKTSSSGATARPPPFARSATSDTISTVTTLQPSSSSRMSMSKFREIGLDDEEGSDASDDEYEARGGDSEERRRRRQIKSQVLEEDDVPPVSSLSYGGGDRQSISPAQRARSQRRRDIEAEREAEEDRQRIREGKGRQPWWTEWICGCGRVVDEDNEQTGKTGPE